MTFFKGAAPAARTVLFGCLALAAMGPVMAQDTTIRTIAGNGTSGYGGDNGPATDAMLACNYDTTHDATGNVYVADYCNQRIRRVDAATGMITTVAGTGNYGYNGDGIAATSADLSYPLGVAIDAAGNLYFTEHGGNRVRRVDATTGLISTVAGTGAAGNTGNGGLALDATLQSPYGIAVDAAGNIYIAQWETSEIRRIDGATGIIDHWLSASYPWNIAVDAAGNLYVTDYSRVLRADAGTAAVTVIAGGGADTGEGVPATSAQINVTYGVDVDAQGNVFFAEYGPYRVRRVDATTGLVRTIAGTGNYGYSGDGGPAIDATFTEMLDVEVSADGTALVVADYGNSRIRGFGAFGSTPLADLSVSTVAANTQAYAGAMLGYGVDVENLGPDAAEFPGVGFALDAEAGDMAVAAPAGWSCDAAPVVGGGTSSLSCMAGGLADGDIASFTVTATAPASAAGDTVTLTAAASSQTADPVKGNDSDSDGTAVLASADLAVALAGPSTLGHPPMGIYTTSVRNLGANPAVSPSVLIRAGVPSGNASMRTPDGWVCVRQATRTFAALCQAEGSIAVGATVQFEATVSSQGKVSPAFEVRAEAESNVADPYAGNNSAGINVKVVRSR